MKYKRSILVHSNTKIVNQIYCLSALLLNGEV